MRILHTSDWHIGRTLYGKRRHEEHVAFLAWLHGTVVERNVDTLLVCGDIFDTISPGNKSQEIYYSFLRAMVDSPCRHVIVIGGNHDSASLLDAPKAILESLHVHVLGCAPQEMDDEIIVLHDQHGEAEAIVCAVPYLRDRDVRDGSDDQHIEDKNQRLVAGIAAHYKMVQDRALRRRTELGEHIPVVVTGHLFTSGGRVSEGDGVRDLYVGTAAEVSSTLFSDAVDYVALGHLHIPQMVGGRDTIRYAGSPIPMGFGEAGQQKQVIAIDFLSNSLFPLVETITIPTFQRLVTIEGPLDRIREDLGRLAGSHESVWVEIVYDGTLSASALQEELDGIVADSDIEILRLNHTRMMDQVLSSQGWEQTLDDLDEREVFRRRLANEPLDDQEIELLTGLYEEVLFSLHTEDDV